MQNENHNEKHMGFMQAIGNTPLIYLSEVSEATGCAIYGKAEFMNPGGSVKDRAARGIITSAEAAGSLKPGGIIVDLAVEQGGNCPLSRAGEIVEHHGVRIIGHVNVPGRLPVDASALYARNLYNFVSPFVDREAGAVEFDWNDELVTGTGLTRDGSVVHPSFRSGD